MLKGNIMEATLQDLLDCKQWFLNFLNIDVCFYDNRAFLEIEGFSVEISQEEIAERARQYREYLNNNI